MKYIISIIAAFMIMLPTLAFADHIVTADIKGGYGGSGVVYSIYEDAATDATLTKHRQTYSSEFVLVAKNNDSNNDTGANAGGGGKVNNPWQPGDADGDVCTAFLPAGLDIDSCSELASTSSGKTYLCGTLEDYIVYCPDN